MTESPTSLSSTDATSTVNPPATDAADHEWQIGAWTFRPLLHRLSREGRQVRLEPKVSDLLLFLALRARQPVGKDAIFEGVWEQKFLGDSALTRTMAELRRALGDDARSPSYIETIPKIGYRLIAEVQCRSAVCTAPDTQDRLAIFGPWALAGLLLVALASVVAVPTFRPTIGASPKALSELEGGAVEAKLVAVLPLAELSHGPVDDTESAEANFFTAGMTEALEARLAEGGTVSVISRHSVERLLAADVPLLDRARGVGIDALVEGTVQRAGDRVKISVRLTELSGAAADRDTYSWVETYERDLRDVLALQEEVSRAIAHQVRQTLMPPTVVQSSKDAEESIDPEAYEIYLQARYLLNQGGRGKSMTEVAELFDRALALDPDYAPAHSGKARVFSQAAEYGSKIGGLWGADLWDVALASADRALERDPQSAEAHAVSGMAEILHRWDWQSAERHLRQALATNPSDAWVRQRYAYFLTFQGRFDEAVGQVEKALKLDPLSPVSYRAAAHVYFHAGRYDRVHAILEEAANLLDQGEQAASGYEAWTLAMEGRYDEALEEMEKRIKKVDHAPDPTNLATYGWMLAQAGRVEEAQDVHRQMLDLSWEDPFARAILEAGLGNHDEAFAALERALEEKSRSAPYLKVEPFLRSLHDDPRFDPLVARLGL